MRLIALDTETTGLDPKKDHRIIEIGCVEIINRQMTNNTFHFYLNPEREIDAGAIAVHGLTEEFLSDKPKFADIANEFLSYVQGAHLVIHNAPFDLGFLDHELKRIGQDPIKQAIDGVTDSLLMARDLFPGRKNSLDALCDRLAVDNSHRQFHGALLDAQLLAEVYLAMTRGQENLAIHLEDDASMSEATTHIGAATLNLPICLATAQEIAAHESYLEELKKQASTVIWPTSQP